MVYEPTGKPERTGNTEQTEQTMEQAREEVKQTAGQIREETRQTAGQVVEQARHQGKSLAIDQKEQISNRLGSIAQALHESGQKLCEQGQEPVGQFVDKAGDQVDRIARYLREKDVDQIVGDVEDVAKRQPALFLGGAFALGLLSARFLKSSGRAEGTTAPGPRAPIAKATYPPGRTHEPAWEEK